MIGMPELGDRQPTETGLEEIQTFADHDREQPARDPDHREYGKGRRAPRSREVARGTMARDRTVLRASRRQRSTRRRAARTRGSRTRTATTRSRARPPRVVFRTSPTCPRRHRMRAGSCVPMASLGSLVRSSEPNAPPVTMIGPSAPNGPPVPMATAADSGFATAARGAMRLWRVRIDSMASGIP